MTGYSRLIYRFVASRACGIARETVPPDKPWINHPLRTCHATRIRFEMRIRDFASVAYRKRRREITVVVRTENTNRFAFSSVG